MVRRDEADAFVSAGSSGAILVGGQVIVGRIKGVERPPLATAYSDGEGSALLIDVGAQCGCKAVPSGTVCKDGLHLHGECGRYQESACGDC